MRHEIEDLKLRMIKWSIFTIIILVMSELFKIKLFLVIGCLSLGWCLILFAMFIYFSLRHFYDK